MHYAIFFLSFMRGKTSFTILFWTFLHGNEFAQTTFSLSIHVFFGTIYFLNFYFLKGLKINEYMVIFALFRLEKSKTR